MRLLLLVALCGCAKTGCVGESHWFTKNGQALTVGCGQISYRRPTPDCQLSGTYQNVKNGRLIWNLSNGSCFFKKPINTVCYIYTQAEPNVMGFSCQEIGVHALFERIQ